MRVKRQAWGWRAWARRFSSEAVVGPRNVKHLTQEEVGEVLKSNEYSKDIDGDPVVERYTTNQFPANSPMEDRSAEAWLVSSQGSLFGVFDGHAGHSCAEVVSNRLFHYIATALLPESTREKVQISKSSADLVEYYRSTTDTGQFTDQAARLYDELRLEWTSKLKRTRQNFSVEDGVTKAFLRMDADIGRAAEAKTMVEPAMSGAVACVALIRGRDLYVAGTGDCGAVVGRQTRKGKWSAIKMTKEHTARNKKEVTRLKSQHPPDEGKSIIQNGRLFGSLMPLRAFGDFRYKWPTSTLESVAVPTYGRQVISANYRTPPYLTALPDVTHRRISAEDKFLVLATDGLWDVLSPEMVVQLIGDQSQKIPTNLKLNPFYYEEVFPRRAVHENISMSPEDAYSNPSTYVLRAALGGSIHLVRRQLSVPPGEARNIRDDITITIVFFKSDDESQNQDERLTGQKAAPEKDNEPQAPYFNKPSPSDESASPDSSSQKVSEPGKDKGGSMARSADWEDIENAGNIGRNAGGGLDLEEALRSGGVIRSRSFLIPNDHNQPKSENAPPKEPPEKQGENK